MFVLKWVGLFIIWRARRLFGLILVITLAKPVGKFFLRVLNIFSGFSAAVIQLNVKNADVHGLMIAALFGLGVSTVDWFFPLGQKAYLCTLFSCILALFLLESLTFEVVRKQDQNEDLAKRVRRAARFAMLMIPITSELLSLYVFHTPAYLFQVLTEIWMSKGEIVKKCVLWLAGEPGDL